MVDGAPMPDGNSSPCIDGVFISPIPGEVDRGDGFTEFKVSGYGRSNLKPSSVIVTKRPLSTRQPGVFGGYVNYMVFEASGTACVFDDGTLTYEDLGLPEGFLAPFDMKYSGEGTGWMFKKIELGEIRPAPQFEDLSGTWPDGRTITTRVFHGSSPSRGYNVTFEKSGYPDRVVSIPVLDPVLSITSRSLFGKFSEVVFSCTRNKSEGI